MVQGKNTNNWDSLERLRYVLKKQGLTQKDFAEKIGMRPDSLSKIKNGEANFSAGCATKIQNTFGWRVEWLLHGTGPRKIKNTVKNGEKKYNTEDPNPNLDRAEVDFSVTYYCNRCWNVVGWLDPVCKNCQRKLDWENSQVPVPGEG